MPATPKFPLTQGCPGAKQDRVLEVRRDRRYTGRVRVVPFELDDGDLVEATVWESQPMQAAAEIAAVIPRVEHNKGWPPRQLVGWLDIQDKRVARFQARTYVRDDDVISIRPWPLRKEPVKPVKRHA